MKVTVVAPMKYVFVKQGVLRIDRIGAGVGVIIFNSTHKIAAGFHVLRATAPSGMGGNPAYYADTVIPYVLKHLSAQNVLPPYYIAVAGGASLMSMPAKDGAGSTLLLTVKESLERANLNIKIQETGGTKIRSLVLNIDEGKIRID